jgi:hypothetical protein
METCRVKGAGDQMRNDYEHEESCYAFDLIFHHIYVLQKNVSTLNYQNTKALEQCKKEIEHLFDEAEPRREDPD